MSTFHDLEAAAAHAYDKDLDATCTLVSLTRALIRLRREGRPTGELFDVLEKAVDAQRETQQARMITTQALQLACAQEAMGAGV